jgi:hypothetical protein
MLSTGARGTSNSRRNVDRLVLGLVSQPLLHFVEVVEDVRLASLGGVVRRVVDPLGLTDGTAGLRPVLFLDREVDVRVGVGLPPLALEHRARLAATAGVAATGHDVDERAIRVLRVLLEVADIWRTGL